MTRVFSNCVETNRSDAAVALKYEEDTKIKMDLSVLPWLCSGGKT